MGSIALIDRRSKREIAFHEKAGRSQVVSLSFLFVTRFFSAELPTVATLPSALFDERVFSLGASWVFSFQPVLPPDCRPPVPSEMEVGPDGMRRPVSDGMLYAP